MNGCSLASKFPPRSISAASALSRKYGCVDDGTQEMRTPVDPTVTSRSESSHSSHSNVPLSRTRPMCGHSCPDSMRSEEHTSELQSHSDLVCRLLLEKKKTK